MSGGFGLPGALDGRIRWLFLMFGVCCLVLVPPRVFMGTGGGSGPARVAAAVAAGVLGAWWLYGYKREGFPLWSFALEALALGVIGLGLREWTGTLGLAGALVAFRGLYGAWPQVLGYTLAVLVAVTGVVALTEPGALMPMLRQAPGVPVLALFTAVIAETSRRQGRAAARERVFARLGASLGTTTDARVVSRHTVEAAVGLLTGAPGAWAATVSPDGEVTAVAGPAPASLLAGPRTEHFALVMATVPYGTLVVGSALPLADESRPAIASLAAQASLGLACAERSTALQHHTFHDTLTGLANRQLLREHLGRAMARARRGSPLAVLLIDVDGFKKINDTYGHIAGDQLLAAVAKRLQDTIRGADIAARLGGDEFAVILDGMGSPGDAVHVAGRLQTAIAGPLHVAGVTLSPSAGIGIACWRNHAEIDQLLHDADAALQTAKQAGPGRLAVFGSPVKAAAKV
ncbi:GGDEF domain-containing protein [Dactylosporangium vinaceum]|uniref:Diguanylate cyclase domain-containing protein n=1 Tax=Dactylosporangium vinaceum TaxID=53362 RepID=A0ABV5M3J1_9ACTN|nr:GGDEF domain-containing protein [Dactylosporangium vinaceum]UAB94398.1 GGDEF domain-containing protein [Dactylosporangium vinaceum]